MSGQRVDAKVVLLGKEYGGKTSLVERYLHGRWRGERGYQSTIGAAYGAKREEVFGRSVVLGIWDTAGSEKYEAMSRIYYRGAWAAVVAFDVTDAGSWDRAAFWAHELRENEPSARLYFVATKADKVEDDPRLRAVTAQRVENFAASFADSEEDIRFFETSSKTGANVHELFQTMAKDYVRASANSASQLPSGGALHILPDPEKGSYCSC